MDSTDRQVRQVIAKGMTRAYEGRGPRLIVCRCSHLEDEHDDDGRCEECPCTEWVTA